MSVVVTAVGVLATKTVSAVSAVRVWWSKIPSFTPRCGGGAKGKESLEYRVWLLKF